MIQKEIVDKLIDELAKDGNILNSCRKTGVSPATFYRWRKENPAFKKRAQQAEKIGRQNMASVSSHALLLLVKEKNLGAIKWFQIHNDPRYKPKRRKIYIEHSNLRKDGVRQEMLERMEKDSRDKENIAKLLEDILKDDDGTKPDS